MRNSLLRALCVSLILCGSGAITTASSLANEQVASPEGVGTVESVMLSGALTETAETVEAGAIVETAEEPVIGVPLPFRAARAATNTLSCDLDTYYTIGYKSGKVFKIVGPKQNDSSATVTDTGIQFAKNGSYSAVNGLAVGNDGHTAYAYRRSSGGIDIFRWDDDQGVRKVYGSTGPIPGLDNGFFVAGGMAPGPGSNNPFYFGGFKPELIKQTYLGFFAGWSYDYDVWFHLFQYSPVSNSVSRVGKIRVHAVKNASDWSTWRYIPRVNGDLAVDLEGNVHILYNNETLGKGALVAVRATEIAETQQNPGTDIIETALPRITDYGSGSYSGLAFDSTGQLFLGWDRFNKTNSSRVDPGTGQLVSSAVPVSNTLASGLYDVTSDFASCAKPTSISLQKSYPKGRQSDGDQVKLVVNDAAGHADDSFLPLSLSITTGKKSGIQPSIAGPVIAVVGNTYYVSEQKAAGNSFSKYDTSLNCSVTRANNSVEKLPITVVKTTSDEKTYSLVVPRKLLDTNDYKSPAITCTFENVPKSDLTLRKIVEAVANPTLADEKKPADFTLIALGENGKPVVGSNGVALNGNPPSNQDSLTATGIDPGTYSLSETGPSNYVQKSEWQCFTKEGIPVQVTDNKVTVTSGDKVTCTVTNTSAQLTLLKYFPEGDPENITVSAVPVNSDYTLDPLTALGSETVSKQNTVWVRPDHAYTLAEESQHAYLNNGIQKYVGATPSNPDMTADADWQDITTATVSVKAGEHGIYRFVNAAPPKLHLPLTGGLSRDWFSYSALLLCSIGVLGALITLSIKQYRHRVF